MTARFDNSLEIFVGELTRFLDEDAISKAVFLRDGTGQLSVAIAEDIPTKPLEKISAAVTEALGGYARSSLIRSPATGSGRALLAEGANAPWIEVAGRRVRLIDRRIVGSDWSTVSSRTPRTPRIAFTSLKGGVGRSTALCVAAIHLSLRGFRVLAVDLDLEAPGIGSMLLNDNELPRYGVVDYLVENNLSGIDPDFLGDLIANSPLGGAGGRVAVLPAYGKETFANPWNALGKLSRAYVEDVVDGEQLTVGDQLVHMLENIEQTEQFDVVLIDARAGMHEISGSVFTKMGAETLMFGLDQPQTFSGYSLLIAHLQRTFGQHGAWSKRTRFVHSRAIGDEGELEEAGWRFAELLGGEIKTKKEVRAPLKLTIDDFELDWDDDIVIDPQEESDTITIPEDAGFRNFDPRANPIVLSEERYLPTYDEFLQEIETMVSVDKFDDQ